VGGPVQPRSGKLGASACPAAKISRVRLMNDLWYPYIKNNEKILWTGVPKSEIVVSGSQFIDLLVAVFFMMIGAFLMSGFIEEYGLWTVFFMPFFTIGLIAIPLIILGPFFRRKLSSLCLTNSRGLILVNYGWLGRWLHSYPINGNTSVTIKKGKTWNIYFGYREIRRLRGSTDKVPDGFEQIADGDYVYKLILKIQSEAAT